jgi:hypothetical protein
MRPARNPSTGTGKKIALQAALCVERRATSRSIASVWKLLFLEDRAVLARGANTGGRTVLSARRAARSGA